MLLTLYPYSLYLCCILAFNLLQVVVLCPSVTVFFGTDPRDLYLNATLSSLILPMALPSVCPLVLLILSLWGPPNSSPLTI